MLRLVAVEPYYLVLKWTCPADTHLDRFCPRDVVDPLNVGFNCATHTQPDTHHRALVLTAPQIAPPAPPPHWTQKIFHASHLLGGGGGGARRPLFPVTLLLHKPALTCHSIPRCPAMTPTIGKTCLVSRKIILGLSV